MLLGKISDLETRLMSALNMGLSTKVDVQNLTAIDSKIQSTVAAMIAGTQPSTPGNALAAALNSKLAMNATCQCYDPRVAQTLQTGLASATAAVGSQAAATTSAIAALNSSLAGSTSASLMAAIAPVLSSVVQQSAAITAANSALQSSSSTLGMSLTSLAASLAGSTSSLSNAVSAIGTVNTVQLSTAIASVNSTATAGVFQLSATVSSVAVAAAGTMAAVASVNSSLTAVAAQAVTGLRLLNSSLTSYYVDVRNLSTIDREVAVVVTSLVNAAPGASNALASALASKLNTSQVTALITSSIRCQTLPPLVANGDAAACAGTVSAGSCMPMCNPGYSPSGSFGCVAGTWIGSPVCSPNPCALLTPPTNGAASIINGTTGMNSSFSCNAGFTLLGAASATCLTTGNWSVAVPVCLPNGQSPAGAVSSCTVSTITTTGVYYMAIPGFLGDVFLAFCRVDPDGTKWLMFQRRTDTASFQQPWATYVAGFGTPTTNNVTGPSFWLGLDRLNRITSTGTWKIRIDLQEIYSGGFQSYFQLYSTFSIGNAATRYRLTCGGTTSGTAGDSLCGYHSGAGFYTYDSDTPSSACANTYKGLS